MNSKSGEQTTYVRLHDSRNNIAHNHYHLCLIDINHKIKLGEWVATKMLGTHLLMLRLVKLNP
jgi:hypothetical protein